MREQDLILLGIEANAEEKEIVKIKNNFRNIKNMRKVSNFCLVEFDILIIDYI